MRQPTIQRRRIQGLSLALLAMFALFGLAGTARAADAGEGVRVEFPKDDSLPYEKFGVYIGIDHYANLSPGQQLYGCVADANAMKESFLRLGVVRYALVTDGQASRQGIGKALSDLIEQVKVAKTKTDKPITVVITYAGHGCRLKRLASEEDPSSLDSSWVAADSDPMGTKDVRGFEVMKVHMELARLGAQVLIISDSCHSGSIFRGEYRERSIPVDKERGGYESRLGPQEDLFPQLSAGDQKAGRKNAIDGESPLSGFVAFSACGDNQSAYETSDDKGNTCGKLSLVLRTLLARLGNETTYQELASKVAAEFASRWPGDVRQTPEFHAAYGKAQERFFKGGFPPAHASVVPQRMADGRVKLSIGSLLGASVGSRFTFYKNLDDLAARRNPIATGDVASVDLATCEVRLLDAKSIPLDAAAAISTVRVASFSIATEGDVPAFVKAKLQELNQTHQIELSDAVGKCTAVLRYDPANKTVLLYSPTALPPIDKPDASVPTLRPPILCRSADDAESLGTNLLYAARIQRMMSLSREDESLLKAEMVVDGAARSVNGVSRLAENQRFVIRLTNKSERSKLYVTILSIDRTGDLQIVYPKIGDTSTPIGPGKSRDISFDAAIDDPSQLKPGEAEASILKVLVSDTEMDLSPLAVAPQTGTGKTRAVDPANPLMSLMQDVLQGGDTTRGVPRAVVTQEWATSTLIFGVEKGINR